jgi:alkyldihydroxyacetonephosphate synthase
MIRRPEPPSPLTGEGRSRLQAEVDVDPAFLRRLTDVCANVDTGWEARTGAGRDWWPLTVTWAKDGFVPAVPATVVTPGSPAEVAAVLAVCTDAGVPVTPVAGRSGVCGGSVPVHGGVSLDVTELAGITDIDDHDLLVDVRPGTWGDEFETGLAAAGLTAGHWPQSMAISTVGGWLACRSAGQYSTRYGKVEDMVAGLEVALADGGLITTGPGAPRAAMGPDLTQLFVGSEGTLGVITGARLRVHPAPAIDTRAAWAWETMADGLDVCRRILRRGATPAVLRLYDGKESRRHFGTSDGCVLVVVDEGDPVVVEATMRVVADECAASETLGAEPATTWLAHRNQVPSLADLADAGIVADTIEMAASWRALTAIYGEVIDRVESIPGTLAISGHQSHAYRDGGCLYFSFGGIPPEGTAPDGYYVSVWDTVMEATLRHGGAISHHHGIGINRARHLTAAGDAHVLKSVKAALDPAGVLNPGKLGLPSPFGPAPWPA